MAARKAPLRAVVEGEKAPAPVRAKTITEAAASGTTRELLASLRDRLAKALEDPNCPARDLASNSKRLMEVVREIESIDARAAEEGDASANVQDGEFDASAV